MNSKHNQHGVVLITVLWIIILLTLLVGTLASTIRLTSLSALYYKKSGQHHADVYSAVVVAKMELMLIRMPKPVGEGVDEVTDKHQQAFGYKKKEAYMLNGQDLLMHYPLPNSIGVRIYDHAGKINLRRLNIKQMRQLLVKLLPDKSDKQVNELLNSWQDWVDTDDLKRIGGAEKEYYQSLEVPYTPRNNALETVDELLLIKGFAALFSQMNLDAIFTMYGREVKVNFNLAAKETLLLIPGLDEDDVAAILQVRNEKEIKSSKDLAEVVDIEHLQQAEPWMSFSTSNYYTIGVFVIDEKRDQRDDVDDNGRLSAVWGYTEVVRARGYNKLPQTLRVDPMVQLPAHVTIGKGRRTWVKMNDMLNND